MVNDATAFDIDIDMDIEGENKYIYGRILKGVGGNYQILTTKGTEVCAKPRGILRKEKISPYPGDYVKLSFTNDEKVQYNIDSIEERKSFLIRPAIANIDLMLITCSATAPEPDLYLVDKLIILCIKSKINVAICITKADMDINKANQIKNQYQDANFPIFILGESTDFDDDFKKMKNIITDKIVSFAGQSGVGKSTLLNKIFCKECMEIGLVSEKIGRGKHTTRHCEIFVYENGLLADTPGFSSLELEELEVNGLDVLYGYPELVNIEGQCMFNNCRHLGEKGCLIDNVSISSERLNRYRQYRKAMDQIMAYELKNKKKQTYGG